MSNHVFQINILKLLSLHLYLGNELIIWLSNVIVQVQHHRTCIQTNSPKVHSMLEQADVKKTFPHSVPSQICWSAPNNKDYFPHLNIASSHFCSQVSYSWTVGLSVEATTTLELYENCSEGSTCGYGHQILNNHHTSTASQWYYLYFTSHS